MLHHKAPHRPWEPDGPHGAQFTDRWIPEPETFWDTYDTRTDALHENQQRVANDLTRRDLKLQPPPDLAGAERLAWLAVKPDTRHDDSRGQGGDAHGRGADALEVPALHARLPGHRPVGRRQRRPACSTPSIATGLREEHDRHLHERPGLLPRRPRPVRQAVHVRRVAAHAVPGPLAGSDQAGNPQRRDGLERRFRADVPRRRGPRRPGRHAGPQPAAGPPRTRRRRTGARRCTTATTTTPATTTRARTTASAPARTS